MRTTTPESPARPPRLEDHPEYTAARDAARTAGQKLEALRGERLALLRERDETDPRGKLHAYARLPVLETELVIAEAEALEAGAAQAAARERAMRPLVRWHEQQVKTLALAMLKDMESFASGSYAGVQAALADAARDDVAGTIPREECSLSGTFLPGSGALVAAERLARWMRTID